MTHRLEQLAPGVYAWLASEPRHGHGNCGVVIAADGLTVVDALTTPDQAEPLAASLTDLVELSVRRLALSSSHIAHVGGAAAFPLAAVYGTAQTSHHLDQAPNPDAWKHLHADLAPHFDDLVTRPVTHTVTEPAHLCPASIAIPVAGQQFENLVVQVPGAGVVFAGALAAFGSTPFGFEGDFEPWIESLEQLKGWGDVIVPGHGPIGGHDDIEQLQLYLRACIDADGDVARLGSGPWDGWSDRRFDAVNVERARMLAEGNPEPPPSLAALFGAG